MHGQNSGINNGLVRESNNAEIKDEGGEPEQPGPQQANDEQLFKQKFFDRYVKE